MVGSNTSVYVALIGDGPCGLSLAAHLPARGVARFQRALWVPSSTSQHCHE